MADMVLRFGTDEYKNAKTELQGYQTQLGSLTSQLQPCTLNRDLQLQEYEEAVDYDDLYTAASENLSAAEGELRQLDEDVSKIEQSTERKNGKIISFTKSDGTKIKNDNDAASEYNHQLEIIIQKRSAINTKVEQARQEQLRITQERNSKQLKETQIEKQESDTAQQELDDLNTEINELNAKISPLETAIKKADEDTVDVAAQNNKGWDFYARKELEAEDIKNPDPDQVSKRAEEIKQRNIKLGNCEPDGTLIVGRSIVTLTGRSKGVADDMASAEEAVSQYNSAISERASKAIKDALGKLTAEERAAYDSLPADKKSAIQNQVLEAINKKQDINALLLIQDAVKPGVEAKAKADAEAKAKAEAEAKAAKTATENEIKNATPEEREHMLNAKDMSDSEINAAVEEIMGDLSMTLTVAGGAGQNIGKLTGRLAKKYGAKNAQKILGRLCNTVAKKAGKAIPGVNAAMATYGLAKMANGDSSGAFDVLDVLVSYIPVVGTVMSLIGTENIMKANVKNAEMLARGDMHGNGFMGGHCRM